jgi:hypothetical protein
VEYLEAHELWSSTAPAPPISIIHDDGISLIYRRRGDGAVPGAGAGSPEPAVALVAAARGLSDPRALRHARATPVEARVCVHSTLYASTRSMPRRTDPVI